MAYSKLLFSSGVIFLCELTVDHLELDLVVLHVSDNLRISSFYLWIADL